MQSAPDPPTEYTTVAWPLTTVMKTYTYDFVAPVTDTTTVMQFNMGNQGANTIWIDNVSLAEILPIELPTPFVN